MQNSKRLSWRVLGGFTLAGVAIVLAGWNRVIVARPKPSTDAELTALQQSFAHPPDDSKIMMRWWWFGPAVTTDELDREMRAMKDAGIGGFEVATLYPLTLDDPSKGLVNLRYLSPEHLAAVRSTARTAHELGLRMDMTLGSGWPYGGPYITPDLAAQHLRCLRIPIKPGEENIAAPAVQAGERFIAAFVATGDADHFDATSAHQVAPRADGRFQVPAASTAPRVLLFFTDDLTRQKVKRAAVGAEGWVLDHYSRAALEKHLDSAGVPLVTAGGGHIRAMFCDSLEVYEADWTPGFLADFKQRRGYDLTPYLPQLVSGEGPAAAAVRHDWSETLTELLNENFLAVYQKWCHEHHVVARVQAYGQPPAELSSYRYADLPEGEQGDEADRWNDFTASRWASSAGHLYGVPVISAESWTWIHSLPFRATPLDLKATGDEYFLEGINQLVGHGWPYSPPGVPEPGWHMYAAGALNAHNPWWFAMPDLALYLQRASFILRQGQPANDIALYLPTHDAWASLSPSGVNLWHTIWEKLGLDLSASLLEAGYNFDFIDDDILAQKGRIENGKLAVANQRYSVVVLPGIERIPPATLAKLRDFAQSGGTVIATRRLPALAPGFLHREPETAEVAKLVDQLFSTPSAPGHFIRTEDSALEAELNRRCVPDVAFSPRSQNLGFIHRHTDAGEIYFIANSSNQPVQATATFRVQGENAEWWNLFTGEVAPAFAAAPRGNVFKLDLEPYGSRLLVFSAGPVAAGPAAAPPAPFAGPLPAPLDLSRGWQVTFEGTGKRVSMDLLRSWTDLEGLQYFSGRATYRKSVSVPGGFVQNQVRALLNFGDPTPLPTPTEKGTHSQAWIEGPIREVAEVFVNGRRAGTVWRPPYELDIAPFLHAGENDLEIVVANTAVNEMAGSPWPDRSALNAKYGERFEDQGYELLKPLPSGLLGPIRLMARSEH